MNFDLNEEQRMWKNAVHEFVAREVKPKAREVDEKSEFNWEAARKMGGIGLLGLCIPEEYGGTGVDEISSVIAFEELGWGCGSTALAIEAHNALGCAPIVNWGSDTLKQKFLPKAASGESKLAALSLTEPGAGSDLKGGVTTRGEKKGEEWIINGAKMWVTNASIADFLVTLVRTDPSGGSHSLSLIVVPTSSVGLHIAAAEKKMGVRGSPTHAVTFENVPVPLENLVGEKGRGLQYTLATLDGGRISIAALTVGIARAAFEEALKYSKEREAFGQSIGDFQAIQWMLADAATDILAARLMVFYAAQLKEEGKPYSQEASMAKLFASEMAEQVCRNAIQIHGGYGYSREYPVERMYRDVRVMSIGEGTSEINRMVIARNLLK
jgi:alkylation response protein AidB-like acyl-CoA dehydrogenase